MEFKGLARRVDHDMDAISVEQPQTFHAGQRVEIWSPDKILRGVITVRMMFGSELISEEPLPEGTTRGDLLKLTA